MTALDCWWREITQPILIIGRILREGRPIARVLHVDINHLDDFELKRAVDPGLEIAGQGSSRNKGGKSLNGRDQIIDPLRGRAILAHPVAIAELVYPVLDLSQVARQTRPQRV